MNPVQHILHRASPHEKLNILCGSTHERQNSVLAKTGHNFYAIRPNKEFKTWDERYGKMPENYIQLPDNTLPPNLCFDLVLSQHKFGQFQYLAPLSQQMHLPLVSLEHTTCMPWWTNQQVAQLGNMRGHINVFITNHSVAAWKWQDRGDTVVIHHGVDTDLFCPGNSPRFRVILTVANDYIGRDYVLNFTQYKKVTENLPTKPIGDTPGFSKPAMCVAELVKHYQTSRILLNTAHLSPIPTNMLEGAACGCAIVSCDTCGISEFFTDGYDAFLCKTDEQMRERLELLLVDEELAEQMGKNARKTIEQKCSLDRFTSDWNKIFQMVTENK
jgi:glycosyltransferase involved in cell wall biosynthesis